MITHEEVGWNLEVGFGSLEVSTRDNHWHGHYEAVIIKEGELEFFIEGIESPVYLKEGDMILIRPFTLHCPWYIDNIRNRITLFWFRSSFLEKLGDSYTILSDEKSDYACGYIVRPNEELKNVQRSMDSVINGLLPSSVDYENDVMLLAYYRFILAAFEKFGEPLDSEVKSAGDCEQHIRIKTACTYIEEHLGENISVEKLAQIANYSTSHFFRLFTKIMGCTVKEYTDNLKICEAERLIKTGNHSITEIAYKLGFSHPNNLGRTYKRITGRNLKQDRSGE